MSDTLTLNAIERAQVRWPKLDDPAFAAAWEPLLIELVFQINADRLAKRQVDLAALLETALERPASDLPAEALREVRAALRACADRIDRTLGED